MSPVSFPNVDRRFWGAPVKVEPSCPIPQCNQPVDSDDLASRREVLERAYTEYTKTLAATIITEKPLIQINPDQYNQAVNLMNQRLGPDSLFFVLENCRGGGDVFYVGRTGMMQELGGLQPIGGLREREIGQLEQKERFLDPVNDKHRRAYPLLLRNPQGLIVNIGAGADYKTVQALRSKKDFVISQDVTPALQIRADRNNIRPYACVVQFPEMFESVFETCKGNNEIFLRNVLSNMSFIELQLLIGAAEKLGTNQITAVQSLGISDKSYFISPATVRNFEEELHLGIRNFLTQLALGGTEIDPKFIKLLGKIFFEQGMNTFQGLFTEALLEQFIRIAESKGFNMSKVTRIEAYSDIPPDKATARIDEHFPELAKGFKKNDFNAFYTDPFVTRTQNRTGVKKGSLRIVAAQLVIQVSKEPIKDVYLTSLSDSTFKATQVPRGQLMLPRDVGKGFIGFDSKEGRAMQEMKEGVFPLVTKAGALMACNHIRDHHNMPDGFIGSRYTQLRR